MSSDMVRRAVYRGALAGYLRIGVRLVLGLVTFRFLFQHLGTEAFGFWALLWAFFGYGFVLDFGFAFAAQKRVAELSVRRDWDRLGRVLSTILACYLVSAAVVVVAGFAMADPFLDLVRVDPTRRDAFRRVFQVFLVGVGLAFPLGLFPEILQGQQRQTTAHNVALASIVANFFCVVYVVQTHGSFLLLVVLALLCVLVPWSVAAWLALRGMPEVRLRPGLVSGEALRDTIRFGGYAYLNQLGLVARDKFDPPILGSILGIGAVAPYQAGSKIGEMFGLLTRQLADVLSPAAAHLHARGDREGLSRLLVDGLRYGSLAATPLYLATAVALESLLRLITGTDRPAPEMVRLGQWFLFWNYSLVLTHWVFKRMYLMAGQERRLMWQGLAEAASNLVLSVVLTVATRSMLGVVWGSVIPSLLFGWLLLWPWAAREAGLSPGTLFRRVVLQPWIACLPALLAVVALRLRQLGRPDPDPSLLPGLAGGAIVGALAVAGIWFFALSPRERARILRSRTNPGDASSPPGTPS